MYVQFTSCVYWEPHLFSSILGGGVNRKTSPSRVTLPYRVVHVFSRGYKWIFFFSLSLSLSLYSLIIEIMVAEKLGKNLGLLLTNWRIVELENYFFHCNKNVITAHKSGRDCMWTESHKIYKFWALINQVLRRYFCSCRLWLNKSNHQVKQVEASQSILTNWYQWIDFIQSKRWFWSENFLFSHNPS